MDIVVAIIGSGALSAVTSGLFGLLTRHMDRVAEQRKKADEVEAIQHRLNKLEKDSVRTQLLLLMSDFPQNQQEIHEVAEHYFADLGGNWYMTGMFSKWLTENNLGEPSWFKKEN